MSVPAGMVVVSREEFFSYIGPRDISPRQEPEYSVWETRDRMVVGRSVPGWKRPEEAEVYMLDEALRGGL